MRTLLNPMLFTSAHRAATPFIVIWRSLLAHRASSLDLETSRK